MSVSTVQEITLTSSPPPSPAGYYCPNQVVTFTCIGLSISILLDWRINGTLVGEYPFRVNR